MSFTCSALQHFNHGVLLTRQPLQVDELFEVRLDSKVPKWYGSLDIGATTVSPENVELPSTITSMVQGTTFVLSSDKIVHNGKEMTTISKDLDSLSVCYTRKKIFLTQNCAKIIFDNNVVKVLCSLFLLEDNLLQDLSGRICDSLFYKLNEPDFELKIILLSKSDEKGK